MKKFVITALLIIGCVAGAENPAVDEECFVTASKSTPKKISKKGKITVYTFESTGEGVVPPNVQSVAQAKAMARRAAIIDAYKSLAEKIYGIKINAKDSIKNLMLQNSSVRSFVAGVIKGASIDEESYKEGIYSVTMSVKIDSDNWNKIINNSSY